MSKSTTTSSLDDKVEFSSIVTGNKTGKRGKKKKYKMYNNNDVVIEALGFYICPLGTSMKSYCKEDGK